MVVAEDEDTPVIETMVKAAKFAHTFTETLGKDSLINK